MEAALKKANHEAAAYRKQVEAAEAAKKAQMEAELSETEKLRQALAETQQKAARLERENLQRQAADKAGLPASLSDRLKGETLDELEADAAELVKMLPKKAAAATPPTNPGANANGSGETDEQRRKRLFG